SLGDRSIHQLTAGSSDLPSDVSPDARSLLFLRDVTAYVVYIGDRHGARKLTTQIEDLSVRAPTRDGKMLVAERGTRDGPEVVVIDVATGRERTVSRGANPFPSTDGTRVFYRSPIDARRLDSTSLVDGTSRTIAEFPAELAGGVDSTDGTHVALRRG